MSTMGIASYEPRETHIPCKTEAFDELFEMPVSELRPEQYHTFFSVDLTEPGGHSIIYPGAKILRQTIFQDSIPWILVTLFGTKSGSDSVFFGVHSLQQEGVIGSVPESVPNKGMLRTGSGE